MKSAIEEAFTRVPVACFFETSLARVTNSSSEINAVSSRSIRKRRYSLVLPNPLDFTRVFTCCASILVQLNEIDVRI